MAARSAGSSALMQVLMTVLVVALIAVSLPTCILLGFGMLPTWVALLLDRSPGRYAGRCVGGINFAGVAPYALGLWGGDPSIAEAVTVLTDVFALFVMFGAAALGWLLYLAMPPIVGTFLSMAAQKRIQELRETQKKLAAEWGAEVGETPKKKDEKGKGRRAAA